MNRTISFLVFAPLLLGACGLLFTQGPPSGWTQLAATAYDSTGAVIVDRSIAWSSSNDTIASVAADGILEAQGIGTAVITAHAGIFIGTVDVVVVPPIEHNGASR